MGMFAKYVPSSFQSEPHPSEQMAGENA